MTVYVCPDKDADCGDRPANWCVECPKHGIFAASCQLISEPKPDPIADAAKGLLSAVAALGYPILSTPSTQQQIDLARAAAALHLALYGPAPWPADEFVGCNTGG